jgi:hypothetical protein
VSLKALNRSLAGFATSQWLAPVAVLIAFLTMALLFRFAPALYSQTLSFWGVPVADFPFFDTTGMVYILSCAHQGVDVMIENPCDTYGRTLVYSPLWLEFARLPIDYFWDYPAGWAVDLTFIASLAALPRAKSPLAAFAMLAGLLSYTTAYAVERANNDVIIFTLTVAALGGLAGRSKLARLFGYGIAFLAGALKFYPIALFLLALREPIRRFVLLTVIVTASAGILIYLGRHELAEGAETLRLRMGSWNTDSFGYINLGRGLLDISRPLRQFLAGIGLSEQGFVILVALAMAAQSAMPVRQLLREREFGLSLARLSAFRLLYLIAGAVLITGCFLTSGNINYRGVFLLFTLPGLLTLASEPSVTSVAGTFRQGAGLTLFVMWSEFFRRAVDFATDISGLRSIVVILARTLFWAALQLAWWRLIALFVAILIAFALDSEACRQLRLRLSGAPQKT